MQGQKHPHLQAQGCVDLAHSFHPCFGPRGLPKPRLFCFLNGFSRPPVHCPDTASVLDQMSLDDPQAQTLASAAYTQLQEVGDGAVLVLLLGSSLLEQAQKLLSLGLNEEEIQQGYKLALQRALELMESNTLTCGMLKNPLDVQEVAAGLRDFLSTREPRLGAAILDAVAQCCVVSLRNGEQGLAFDPSFINVAKVIGARPLAKGMDETKGKEQRPKDGEINREKEGKDKNRDASTAEEEQQQLDQVGLKEHVRAGGKIEVEDEAINGKGKRRNEWEEWVDLGLEIEELRSAGEGKEEKVNKKRAGGNKDRAEGDGKEMRACREKVVMWGKRDISHHRINQMILRVWKRFLTPCYRQVQKGGTRRKLHRLKGRVGIRQLARGNRLHRNPKNPSDHSGTVHAIVSDEPYNAKNKSTKVRLTLYGSDPHLLDSAERAIHSSLKLYQSLLSEPRLLPGAGQAEVALAGHLTQYGLCLPGLEQLAVHAFAQALFEPVRALGQNSGVPGDLAVVTLYGKQFWGAGVEGKESCNEVLDPLACKRNAIKRATKAALWIITQQLDQTSKQGRQQSIKSMK